MTPAEITLSRPHGAARWFALYRLYRTAFPAHERKPFTIILRMYRKGKTDIWYCRRGDTFAGLALTVNGEDLILLDYLAVPAALRGTGCGSAILRALQTQYADKGLFVEIESPYESAENRAERQRRKQFYLANGMAPLHVMTDLFGVRMELLGSRCEMDFARYHTFYRDNLSEWAAQHVIEAVHPDRK